MKKKALSLILVVAMLAALACNAIAANTTSTKPTETLLVPETTKVAFFNDVPSNHWAYKYVNRVVTAALFSGTGKDQFSPGLTMTRAMFVVVLSKLDGAKVDNAAATGFSDVPSGKWFSGAVSWAASKNLVSGYGNGKFGPEDPITRQQLAVLLKQYLNTYKNYTLKENAKITSFVDISTADDYAQDAIEYCRVHGLIGGYGDKTYRPKNAVTRAEVAAILCGIVLVTEEKNPSPSGGGSSGGGPAPTPINYYGIQLMGQKMSSTTDKLNTDKLNLEYNYSNNKYTPYLKDDSTVVSAVKALYSSIGGNDTAIKNYIDLLLGKAADSDFTTSYGSYTNLKITISVKTVDGKYIISATNNIAAVNLNDQIFSGLNTKYLNSFNAFFEKLVSYGIDDTDGNRAIVSGFYDLMSPSYFLKGSGNNLETLTSDEYYALIDERVQSLNNCRTNITVGGSTALSDARIMAFKNILTGLNNEALYDGFNITGFDTATISAIAKTAAMQNPTMSDLYKNLGNNNGLHVSATHAFSTGNDAYSVISHAAGQYGLDISEYENIITSFFEKAAQRGASGTYQSYFNINMHN